MAGGEDPAQARVGPALADDVAEDQPKQARTLRKALSARLNSLAWGIALEGTREQDWRSETTCLLASRTSRSRPWFGVGRKGRKLRPHPFEKSEESSTSTAETAIGRSKNARKSSV
jgi:hypothetical protein